MLALHSKPWQVSLNFHLRTLGDEKPHGQVDETGAHCQDDIADDLKKAGGTGGSGATSFYQCSAQVEDSGTESDERGCE
jgi:hypothetical protein